VSLILKSRPALPDLSPRALIQVALTRLLQRYPSAQALLAHHAGKTFAIVADPLKGLFTIEHDGQLANADPAVVPDVTIEVDLKRIDWVQWAKSETRFDIVSVTRVTGDAGLAQTLSGLLQTLRPDIEDLLAERVGDIPARQLVRAAKSLQQGVMRSGQRITENIAEYLSHETRVLTPQVALQEFSTSLQALAARLQQLHSRQQRLDQSIKQLVALKESNKGQPQ
jgi:ubiquinone biosynthesis protein UbiJ